jgi:hypothetical protein
MKFPLSSLGATQAAPSGARYYEPECERSHCTHSGTGKLTGDSESGSFGFARRGLRVRVWCCGRRSESLIAPHGMPREPRRSSARGLGSSGSVAVRARVGVSRCVCVRSRVGMSNFKSNKRWGIAGAPSQGHSQNPPEPASLAGCDSEPGSP